MKVAVIGDRDSVWLYKSCGFSVYFIDKDTDLDKIIDEVLSQKYHLIVLTEQVYLACKQKIEQICSLPLPLTLILPSQLGSSGLGVRNLEKITRRATGGII